MKLSDLSLDLDRVDNGVWVDDIPGFPGVRFRVRGSDYEPYQQALRRFTLENATKGGRGSRGARRAQLEALDKLREHTRKLVADHLLLGWDGIDDDQGAPLPYTQEDAARFMADRRFRPFQDAVAAAIEEVDSGAEALEEELEGN